MTPPKIFEVWTTVRCNFCGEEGVGEDEDDAIDEVYHDKSCNLYLGEG